MKREKEKGYGRRHWSGGSRAEEETEGEGRHVEKQQQEEIKDIGETEKPKKKDKKNTKNGYEWKEHTQKNYRMHRDSTRNKIRDEKNSLQVGSIKNKGMRKEERYKTERRDAGEIALQVEREE